MTKVLLLYDEITPQLAKEFVGALTKLPATAEVVVAINSPGGHVGSGDAIALAIDRHKGPTTARIDGIAASAAGFVAMFADRVVMSPGSYLMIHCPWASMAGTADDLTDAADVLKKIQARYCSTYSTRSGLPEADVLRMMKAETWLDAARAVELHFADEIDAELVTAASCSKAVLKYSHVPSKVMAMAGAPAKPTRTAEQRAAQRRRMMIIASQAQSSRDPVRERQDRERGDRYRRRQAMQALVERYKADERRRDAQEREEAQQRLDREYVYNNLRIPHEQRR